jgi:hypothetical protein
MTADDDDKPLREMDLAFFEMFDLLLDILVRMGVPKEEFDQQFKNTWKRCRISRRPNILLRRWRRSPATAPTI